METVPSALTTASPSGVQTKPLSSFTRLNPQVSLYQPANFNTSPSSNTKTPTTILLCAWMNAASKHIDYYARTYQSLYPRAQIIILTITTKQFIFESEARRRRDILPAVQAMLSPAQGRERILVHSFSNGGWKRTFSVASVYQELSGTVFSPSTLIFDSAPGMPRYFRDVHAIAVPARKLPLLPWLLFMGITCVLAAVTNVATYWLPHGIWSNLVWGPILGLKDPRMLGRSARVGIVYSKEDLAIDWRDVESWAGQAEQRGYTVARKLIEGAEHAQMFRGKGGERDYWGWVEGMWGRRVEA